MTQDFWNQITPQINEFIADQLVGYTALELYDSLRGDKWWKNQPMNKLQLRLGKTTLAIPNWLDVIGAAGERMPELMNEAFKSRISDAIEYQHEIRMRELEVDAA